MKERKRLGNDEMMQGLTEEECLSFALTHTYLEYRHVLHAFTLMNLPLEVREDLVLLDDSIGHSKQYFEDEVLLYEMLKDGEFSKKDIETLVDTIFSRMYYEGFRKMRKGTELDGFLIGGYFAEQPLREVMNKVAHDAGIKWKDREEEELLEDIETHAKEKAVTMEHLTREALRSWLDDGLFTEHFAPIFVSDRLDTLKRKLIPPMGDVYTKCCPLLGARRMSISLRSMPYTAALQIATDKTTKNRRFFTSAR
jgi:hypothetical protein